MKRFFKASTLKYVAVFLLPIALTIAFRCGLNNDTWFQLAEGNYVAEQGFFTTDPLTMHEGLNVTLQIPAYLVLLHWVYGVFGELGIYIMMLLVSLLFTVVIYKLCMLLSNKNANLSLALAAITSSMLGFFGFFVTRPQVFSYLFMASLILVLELYIKTKNAKWLWFLPVLSLLQINFHASLWWLLIIVVGVYIIDGFKLKNLHLEGYKKRPLVLALIGMIAVGLINPYGYRAILYVLTSFYAWPIAELVSEMKPFAVMTPYGLLVYGIIVLVALGFIYGNKRNVRMRHLMLFFGFLALSIGSHRGLAQLFTVMFFPLALVFKDFRLEKLGTARVRSAVMVWSSILIVYLFAGACVINFPNFGGTEFQSLRMALDVIEEDVAASGKDKSQLKIYTGYGDGSYLEFRGYKPYLDPRAEVFLKINNGKENILEEWYELKQGAIKVSDFLDKYEFDYLLVRVDSAPLYDLEDENYERIYKFGDSRAEVYRRIEHEE